VLRDAAGLALIVVDGYVDLDPAGRRGLAWQPRQEQRLRLRRGEGGHPAVVLQQQKQGH
jgi:hypothetical protein